MSPYSQHVFTTRRTLAIYPYFFNTCCVTKLLLLLPKKMLSFISQKFFFLIDILCPDNLLRNTQTSLQNSFPPAFSITYFLAKNFMLILYVYIKPFGPFTTKKFLSGSAENLTVDSLHYFKIFYLY
jgi:hypothetical protein